MNAPSTGATPDVIGSQSAPDVSTTAESSPAPDTGTSSPDVKTDQPVQEATPQTDDPLAGFPPDDELKAAVDSKTPWAEMAQRLKSAYSDVKPQFDQLKERFSPYESVLERFQTVEELQPAIELNDALFSDYERDGSGQLVPAVTKGVELMFQRDQQRAGYFWAEAAEKQVPHPETGQPVKLIDLALEGMRDDPTERQRALSILGGVEPSAQAPTWAPTEEQLAVVKDELKDTFRNLPYDEREDLSANTPEFINKYLTNQKFQQDLIEQNKQAQELQVEQQRQRDQQQRQQAEQAGNKYVEDTFRSGFTEFANSIVERSKFIPLLDAESAQGMAPEQVQAYNQQAEQINTGVGLMVATVTAALSHPDTQWVAAEFLSKLGVDAKVIQQFDQARQEFASNARNYGELAHVRKDDPSISGILTNTNRAMTQMKGRGNLVAQPLLGLLSKFFEMKATSYNATLNSNGTTRPQVNGHGYDPTTATPSNLPTGKLSRAELDRMFG